MKDIDYVLPENMTIGSIGHCHVQLLDLLEKSQPIILDISNIKQIDTAGVQLLMMFVMMMEGKELTISWIGGNQSLEEVSKRLGFQNTLFRSKRSS